jgi:adenylate cyclase
MTERKRQLVAIMFTDIAGFTTMMGRDENKTLELLHKNRVLQKPLIEQHDGKWLKEMGDGVLASFDSAYHAVQCAIDIQQRADEDLKNKIRIGIHLGDVTIEDGDVFGDGVNIASRLEAIADPGGIYISDPVHKMIRAKSEISSQYICELHLKNVENKIGAYAVIAEGLTFPSQRKIKELSKGSSKPRSVFESLRFYVILISSLTFGGWLIWSKFFVHQMNTIHSLAILPFSNYTGDENQAFLVGGMHDALISEMGKVAAIRVVSRTSTLAFADTRKSISEIASDLDVDAIIEGSLLPASHNSIKIQLTLVSAMHEESQLWSKSYEFEKEKVLDLYNDITKTIAEELHVVLSPEESRRLKQSKTVNPQAYESYLRGRTSLSYLTPDAIASAEQHFLRATEIDSGFAPAYAGLAGIWVVRKQLMNLDPRIADPKISEYINHSFRLDSTDAETWRWYASKLAYDYNWTGCLRALDRCLELNPNFAEARAFYAHYMMMQNNWNEAWKQIDLAVQLDPLNPLIKFFRQVMLMHSGRFEELQGLGFSPFPVYAVRQEYDSAISSLKALIKSNGVAGFDTFVDSIYESTDFKTALNATADSLVSLSDSRPISLTLITLIYQNADNINQTLYWLEKMYIRRDPNLPYWAISGPLRKPWLLKEPRYIEIMERINLR